MTDREENTEDKKVSEGEEEEEEEEEAPEAFSAWCRNVEATLEELSAQMRGLLQVQAQLNPKPPEKKIDVVAAEKKREKSAEDEEKAKKKRELRRRVMQCEVEDLHEENEKLRRKIRQMMTSQRDSTLTFIMITAFIVLLGSIIIHFFVPSHRLAKN